MFYEATSLAHALTDVCCPLARGRFLYVQMEFCSEGPLTKHLSINTDVAQRDKWIVDLTRGLQHIHSSLVIHRDIKPDNLLLATDSSGHQVIKYIDFGLAIELSEPTSIVGDGKQAGTPTYLSPELEARQPYAFPTDLWSLGVVFLQVSRGVNRNEKMIVQLRRVCRTRTDVYRRLRVGPYDRPVP